MKKNITREEIFKQDSISYDRDFIGKMYSEKQGWNGICYPWEPNPKFTAYTPIHRTGPSLLDWEIEFPFVEDLEAFLGYLDKYDFEIYDCSGIILPEIANFCAKCYFSCKEIAEKFTAEPFFLGIHDFEVTKVLDKHYK